MILMCVLATIRRKSGPQPHADLVAGCGTAFGTLKRERNGEDAMANATEDFFSGPPKNY